MPFSGLKVFETSFWDLICAKEDCSKLKLHGPLHPILVGNMMIHQRPLNRAGFSELHSQTSVFYLLPQPTSCNFPPLPVG